MKFLRVSTLDDKYSVNVRYEAGDDMRETTVFALMKICNIIKSAS